MAALSDKDKEDMCKGCWLLFITVTFYIISWISWQVKPPGDHKISFVLSMTGLSVHFIFLASNPYFNRKRWQIILLGAVLAGAWALLLL